MPEDIFGRHVPKHNPELGTWASTNWVQRTGLILFFPLVLCSWIFDGKAGSAFGVAAWSSIFLGYVAGNLYKYRHALHFWWSVAIASLIHASLSPLFIRLTNGARQPHSGKGYAQLAFGVLIVEVLLLLFIVKRTAMWIHRRQHRDWPAHNPNGAFRWTLDQSKDKN